VSSFEKKKREASFSGIGGCFCVRITQIEADGEFCDRIGRTCGRAHDSSLCFSQPEIVAR
jgi:hypothetical protein